MEVSVVIPAYNAATFIAQAIDSVLSQSRPVDEIIVVDDGSEDETRQEIEKFGSRVQYVRQENSGPSVARNRGIELANHPWVAFLDADDIWLPDKTNAQFAVLTEHPELALIASDMAQTDSALVITEPSSQRAHGIKDQFEALSGRPIPDALAKLMEINFIPTGTVLAQRDVLLSAGGFPVDIRYGEDLALWARVAGRHPIACLPTVHMHRRQHESNATKASHALFRDIVTVTDRIRDWGRDILAAQHVDADQLVARAWGDLGYSYFTDGEFDLAREAFAQSMVEKPNKRALFYRQLCRLSPSVIQSMRKLKQRISGRSADKRNHATA